MPLYMKLFVALFLIAHGKRDRTDFCPVSFWQGQANGSAPVQGIHIPLRRHDAQGHQLPLAGIAEVVAHAAGHMDPGAELQGHPFLVDEEKQVTKEELVIS